MRKHTILTVVVTALALGAAACGGGSSGAAGGGEERVTITSPSDGAAVQVPFTLTWDSTVPLGPPDSGKDHVHVYVDGDENDYTVVGGNRFRVEDLSPGKHDVEISLQHADHSPVGPTSTVSVTVGGRGGSPSPDSDPGGGYGY
jgi:hypothetical protein